MKAIIQSRYGSPEILSYSDIEKPTPKANELLIRVKAATVNRTDCGILRAAPFILRLMTGLFRPRRQVSGTDFAGVVEAVGAGVTLFNAGDRVFGFDDMGLQSHAEFLTIAESKPISTIPEGISFEQAAASLEGAHYGHNFINKVNVTKDSRVCINGATGAIGSATIQFVKQIGAEITATGNTPNLELIQSLGASHVIDYTKDDFTQLDETFDYVFDTVGKSSFGKCKRILAPKGVYISSELGPRNENPFLALVTPLFGRKRVGFPFPESIKESIDFITERLENGSFEPVIDRRYSLEKVPEAFHYAESGQKTGNIIITIPE